MITSAELARQHYKVHTDPAYQSWCRIGEHVDCQAIELSPHAVLFGVPVAVWGIFGYGVLALLAISGLRPSARSAWPRGALLVVAHLYAVISLWHAYIAFAVIGYLCLLCTATYVINAVLLVAAWSAAGSPGQGARAVRHDFGLLLARWPGSLVAGAALAGAMAALILNFPRYWQRPDPAAAPTLVGATGVTDEGLPWIGAAAPAHTVVEFSDYACPYCRDSHAEVRALVARHPDRVRLVHRHFPLDVACNDLLDRPMHEHACRAALAAICCAEQGKFWPVNDALFAAQDTLLPEAIDAAVSAAGVDRPRFVACVESAEAAAKLQRDISAAEDLGAAGAPLYLIDGAPHPGAINARDLARRLDLP